ncbi:MAG TPA: NPCBM/NEW2 domain-containing protein [Fimbriiglobus sp.]|jgi:hypothetical protein
MFGLILWTLAGVGQVQPPATWIVTEAGGKPRTIVVQGIADGWGISVADGTSIPKGDLLSLRRKDLPLPPWPDGPQALLVDGTRVAAKFSNGTDRAVTLTHGRALKPSTTISLVFGSIDVLWLVKPAVGTPTDPAKYAWLPKPRKKDVLLLRSGDTITGTLDRFENDGKVIRFLPEGKKDSTPLDTSSVAAVAFDPSLSRPRSTKGPVAEVTFADGSRLRFASASGDGRTFRGRLVTGGTIEIPLNKVVSIDLIQGKAVYLADLKPKTSKFEPFLGTNWHWTANRSVKGNPLRLNTRLGEETFDRGLGTHPKTTLVYDLGGKYKRFEAVVGLDAATGTRGRAAVRVMVDGKDAAVPGLTDLSAADCVPISVAVTKAKELTLIVDFGPGGDVQADVDWADARLVK